MLDDYRKKLRFFILIVSLSILCGCATYTYQYPPVTIEVIIKLSKERIPAEQIISIGLGLHTGCPLMRL